MVGITATEVVIRTAPSEDTGPADWDALGPVAEELVERSGARRLRVDAGDIPTPFIAGLVAARPHWEEVRMPFSAALDQRPTDGHRVDRLILSVGPEMLQATPAFIQMLRALQVRTLVVEGLLDLSGFAQALASPSSNGLSLSHLEGSFVFKDGGNPYDTLAALARDVRVEKTVHRPPPGPAPAGYTLVSPMDVDFLQALNVVNQSKLLLRVHGDPSAKPAAWDAAVLAISDVLAPHRQVSTLIGYLGSVENTFVAFEDLSWLPQAPTSIQLNDKLQVLKACGFPQELVRDAIAHRLRLHPADAQPMCQAMVVVRFPGPTASNADWWRMGQQHRKAWQLPNTAPDVAGRVLPLVPALSASTSTTTTTTTTTTPGTTTTATSTADTRR